MIDEVFREEWGRLVATLIRLTRDWDLAEDCAQDAFAQAARRWPAEGVPDNPGAWLTTVARNRALDVMRRGTVEAEKLALLAAEPEPAATAPAALPDERLELIFTCCHPALPMDARVALTLRAVGGLTTAEIARAFLVGEPTMGKRLTRAKAKIRHAGIPFRVPPAPLLPERLAGVLAVLYLVFNEGYTGVRDELCDEATRLARLVTRLLPGEPEATGLLALMLLQDARRAARRDADGPVLLGDQDRSLWDQAKIAEGLDALRAALAAERTGPYQLQAAIASCHALARTADATDWPRIARLYAQLEALTPNPVVRLNRAVAVGLADGPEAGLALIDGLELPGYHRLPAVRADLLRRLGRDADAARAYREALALAATPAERRQLETMLAEVSETAAPVRRVGDDPS